MVRQRRPVPGENRGERSTNSSSSNGSSSNIKDSSFNLLSYWKQMIVTVVILIATVFGYLGYLETRVNTPFDDRKVVTKSGLDDPKLFWGTYRPGVYFGLKTREANSLVTGLMWYFPRRLKPGGEGLRHTCEQSDNLSQFGWVSHDGIDFGVQEIIDHPFWLRTSFVKRVGGSHGGDWTARIEVGPLPKRIEEVKDEPVSLIWYIALDQYTKGYIMPTNTATKITGIRGQSGGLGDFTIKFQNVSGSIQHESFLSTVHPSLEVLKETVFNSLRLARDFKTSGQIVLAGEQLPYTPEGKSKPNLVAIQITAKVPFVIDVVFESGSFGTRPDTFVGDVFTKTLDWHCNRFNQKFENIFKLRKNGYEEREEYFARAALSNMIGGIGYFYGASIVQSSYNSQPVYYWNAPLYTAVPSRSFFPRGFLWDEGFHGLLISQWDLDIELDIMSHWFDLMNAEGWIPREQILGAEAIAKVPMEFIVQKNTNANPPTFYLTLKFILDNFEDKLTQSRLDVLDRMYPRLQAWFSWFNTTQRGIIPGTYRWRGRDGTTKRELNPKTLTSGLDDYPRASHPTDEEYHVDLYCWIALAAETMAKLARLLGHDSYKYSQTAEYLKNNELLDKLHWSEYAQTYADYGLHTDAVKLERPKPLPRSENQNMEMIRVTEKSPEYRLVDTTFGYVSLFPFLLQIIDPNSVKLESILNKIRDPEYLWTDFGLRSLSKNSPLYKKRNTEHDPPYWRGQIWININYLAVRALKYYAGVKGPYQKRSWEIYKELKKNIIKNMVEQFYKTGYIWEQYNDTGEGSGCRPFNGWSALVVHLMSEKDIVISKNT